MGAGPSGAGTRTECVRAAGADEVVVEAVEAAVRFSQLLDVESAASDAALRALSPLARDDAGLLLGGAADDVAPPYTEDELRDLAEKAQLRVAQVVSLYAVFATLDANDDGEVSAAEVREAMMRTSAVPIDDEALSGWVSDADADGGGSVDFFEFVRFSAQASSVPAAPGLG